ncbi:SIR2 family protein [Paenibacillus sp. FSL R7-0331]|uniref:SIR2 family protein n=1 Tax=Paenibacillus sp. FSL R7-0331 TaxID=1536773 RepID=UPI0005A6F77E|nr:SIR2 family protein [Paenibacillus sp. FSL R7-0331]
MSDGYIYKLARSIQNGNTILFAGAGVSRNLSLPTYEELINQLAEELSFDPEIYWELGNKDYLALAEYYLLETGSMTPLMERFQSKWMVSSEMVKASKVHELLVQLKFPIIYTTNYDNGLEMAFEEYAPCTKYHKIANVEDIAKSSGCDTQIIKFHGDMETKDESTIVLTESSFFDRLDFESPLDIKFRSDILGKSILFLGHSLSDINIRVLLHKLDKIWKSFHSSVERPPVYMFLTSPNPIQERLLRARGITPIISRDPDPRKGTIAFLEQLVELNRKMDAACGKGK